ncbi:MAG: MFS transporter [Lachnospiraceae bacterium]|nr:MFS transporter [Lachnospiraceae bacterium]
MENREHTAEKVGYRDILKQTEYLKIILAGLINRFGDSIDAIAFTWLVYAITGNAAWSALVFAANQLPSVLVQPFAGALVEGMDKKKLMVVTDIVRGITTSGLAILYLAGGVSPWILLAFTLINSTVEAFRLPAALAVMPLILEEKYYAYGTSLNSTLSTIVQLIGLGVAGVIIASFGIGTAIVIDGISFFGSALILSFLRLRETNLRRGSLPAKEYIETLKDGLRYLKEQPVIRNFCLLSVLINAAITPLNSLQSPLIQEVMGQGSALLSAFSLAITAGMGIGSFVYPFVSSKFSVRLQFSVTGTLVGAGMCFYTLGVRLQSNVVLIYTLTTVTTFVIGMSCSILVSALSVQFMKTVKQDYLARVGSIFNAGASAATPAASLAVSALAAFCSVSQIFICSGAICVIIFLMLGLIQVRLE